MGIDHKDLILALRSRPLSQSHLEWSLVSRSVGSVNRPDYLFRLKTAASNLRPWVSLWEEARENVRSIMLYHKRRVLQRRQSPVERKSNLSRSPGSEAEPPHVGPSAYHCVRQPAVKFCSRHLRHTAMPLSLQLQNQNRRMKVAWPCFRTIAVQVAISVITRKCWPESWWHRTRPVLPVR